MIVGAGLAGLSAAYHLLASGPDRKVTVLEASHVGAGASGHSTGMLTPGVGQSLPAMIKRLGEHTARRTYLASLEAVRYAQDLVGRLDIDCQLEMSGQLIVSPPNQNKQSRLRAQLDAFRQLDLPHDCWDSATLEQRAAFAVPAKNMKAHAPAAIHLPVAGTLHPGLLLEGLADRITDLGGEIHQHSPVASITSEPSPVVHLNSGASIKADHVIVATSGYSGSAGFMKGRVLPVHLSVIATEPLGEAQLASLGWRGRECIIDCRRLFNYFRLTEDNRIVFGGGMPRYRWGGSLRESRSRAKDWRALSRELKSVFHMLDDLKIAHAWTGVIGYVLDTMPTVRPLKRMPGVHYVGAWSGHGIALSIRSGAWITDIIEGREATEDLPWFNHTPPWIPTEPVRWCSFKLGVRAMALMDKFLPESRDNGADYRAAGFAGSGGNTKA